MRKTFKMTHPTIKVARLFEAARCDVKRYVKRERRRTLPEGADFWDFDCKFGSTEEDAKPVHLAELGPCISVAETQQMQSFYVEILAKSRKRTKDPNPAADHDGADGEA